jgi:phosphatidylglycerol lysyltransferase
VFYESSKQWLHVYADFGLTFAKLGEEARVFLPHFALEGSGHKKLRTTLSRLQREAATLRIVEPPEVTSLMPELRAVSNAWLTEKTAAEKGFSLGFFTEEYVERFPVAILEVRGRIEAFRDALAEPTEAGGLRGPDALQAVGANGVMDGLFAWLFAWAKQEGYQWFNLGMAPLSGSRPRRCRRSGQRWDASSTATANRSTTSRGCAPTRRSSIRCWEPRYLAYPGGLALPRVVTDVSALIAGGYRRIFTKP